MKELLGRKAKIISNKHESRHKIGSVGIITDIREDEDIFLVDVDGEKCWHMLDSVELIPLHPEQEGKVLCGCGEFFTPWEGGGNETINDWCGQCIPF